MAATRRSSRRSVRSTTSIASSRRRATSAWRSRSTTRCNVRRTIRGCREHPDWFHIRADGTIKYAENPPKKYQDIYPLNFWCADRENLWNACRDVLLFWIEHGVKIFRVDNPHTKPFAFWEWMIRDIQTRRIPT